MTRERVGAPATLDDVVSLEAEKLIGGGRALAHHGGATWMVAGALPGERVRAAATGRRAGIIEARTLEVEGGAHPARLEDPCPQAGVCGGCDWPYVDPDRGAPLKAAAAAEAARSHADLAALISNAPFHRSEGGYRLRARLHWDPIRRRLGFYQQRSRLVASIDPCRILTPSCMRAVPAIVDGLASRCPQRVDVEWLEGSRSGDAVAALQPAKGGPPKIDAGWVPGDDDVGAVVAGFHSLPGDGRMRVGWGAAEVTIDLPIPLAVPIGSFFQGNRHLVRSLFDRVAELVGRDVKRVVDLHAGVGYLAAAARHAADPDLTLVEPNRLAALAARRNLPGAKVVVGSTAEDFLAGVSEPSAEATVITDPPRTGLSRRLRNALAHWLPQRVVMLGCDPATWARDAGFLVQHGYRPLVVELYDLFPSTHHVEILALLVRA